jgi:hypothetical protein
MCVCMYICMNECMCITHYDRKALGYGLDDRGSRVRFLAGAGNFFLHRHVQNGSGVHPASYPMGTGGLLLWRCSGRGVKLTTHLNLLPTSRMRGAIPPLRNTSSLRSV